MGLEREGSTRILKQSFRVSGFGVRNSKLELLRFRVLGFWM